MDSKALAQYVEVHDAIAARWRVGTMQIIRETNKPMYDRMDMISSKIDEMLAIENKTKKQRDQFVALLAAFKRLHELGMVYAERRADIAVESLACLTV